MVQALVEADWIVGWHPPCRWLAWSPCDMPRAARCSVAGGGELFDLFWR